MMNYIAHHGIKGQRWGVRRYQNEDGSLTAAGKARYIKDGTKTIGKTAGLAIGRASKTAFNEIKPKLKEAYKTSRNKIKEDLDRRMSESESFGSKERVERAKSAAILSNEIRKLEKRKNYSKAEKLRNIYNSKISGLDPKEIKFGENYVKVNLARYGSANARSVRTANSLFMLSSSPAGANAMAIGSAIRYANADRKMSKEIAENNRLSREFKAARAERRKNR